VQLKGVMIHAELQLLMVSYTRDFIGKPLKVATALKILQKQTRSAHFYRIAQDT